MQKWKHCNTSWWLDASRNSLLFVDDALIKGWKAAGTTVYLEDSFWRKDLLGIRRAFKYVCINFFCIKLHGKEIRDFGIKIMMFICTVS